MAESPRQVAMVVGLGISEARDTVDNRQHAKYPLLHPSCAWGWVYIPRSAARMHLSHSELWQVSELLMTGLDRQRDSGPDVRGEPPRLKGSLACEMSLSGF